MLLLLTLLGGCLANTGGTFYSGGQKEAPTWLLSPPADTSAVFYGVGQGLDLEEARLAALRDVAAKLRVSISASTEAKVSVSNNNVDRFSTSKVNEEVRKTTFAKHQLEKSEVYSNGVYALVSVDRQLLVAETKNRLEEKDRALRTGLDKARSLTGLERLRIASQLKPAMEDVVDLLSLMNSASPGFSRLTYAKQVEAWHRLNDDTLRNLSFRLQFQPADQDVAIVLRQMMSESEYRIVEGGSATGVVHVSTESKSQVIFGSTQVRLSLHVSLRSDKGGVFSQKEFQSEGSSLGDNGAARQAAVRKLASELKKRGTAELLGLDSSH
jgi:hypothetical protein